MSDRLVVDMQMLQAIASQLDDLMEQFDQSSDIVNDNHAAVGESQLQGALGDFAGDWKTHRENLVKSMKSVQQSAQNSYDTYTKADTELSQALQRAEKHTTARIPGSAQ